MKIEDSNRAAWLSLLLSLIAGYADTVTFTAAGNLFSAHVTGNFVVFVYNLFTRPDSESWLKLLSFPFFITAVIVSCQLFSSLKNSRKALLGEGILLLSCGLIAWYCQSTSTGGSMSLLLISMIIVFAMGMQNALGKLFSKETVAPTTVMTGNVTQIVMDIARYAADKNERLPKRTAIKKQAIVIGGFLLGCIAGGGLSIYWGLAAIALPGLLLILFCLLIN